MTNKLTFYAQIHLGLGIFILCLILAHVTKLGFFSNLGWIIYGLFFLLNPVWPKMWDHADHTKLRRGSRIAGALAIAVGLLTRFGV